MPKLATLCFVAGLGLTNQHTLVLLVAPLAAWVLLVGGMRHRWTVAQLTRLFAW